MLARWHQAIFTILIEDQPKRVFGRWRTAGYWLRV